VNFTKVFIPRQAPCCKTSRPAGWGSTKDARSFYTRESRPTCRPLQITAGGAACHFSVLLHERELPGKPEAKAQHVFQKEGRTKRAIWEHCLQVSLLPHSSLSNGREWVRKDKFWDSLT